MPSIPFPVFNPLCPHGIVMKHIIGIKRKIFCELVVVEVKLCGDAVELCNRTYGSRAIYVGRVIAKLIGVHNL